MRFQDLYFFAGPLDTLMSRYDMARQKGVAEGTSAQLGRARVSLQECAGHAELHRRPGRMCVRFAFFVRGCSESSYTNTPSS